MSESIGKRAIRFLSSPFILLEISMITAYIAYMCFRLHQVFYTIGFSSFDISVFHQGIWLMSTFHQPFVTIRGLHLFADHSTFINMLFIPAYWVYPSHLTLLYGETIALGCSAFLIYLIAKKQLGSELWGVFLSAIFLMYPALHYLNIFQYHPVVFSVPFILLFWIAYLYDKANLGLLATILLVLVQEEVIVVLIGFSFYLFFFKKWKPAKSFFFIGIVSLVLAVFVIMPFFIHSASYQYTGRTLGSLTATLTGRMDVGHFIWGKFATLTNLDYLFRLFGPLSFLPLINPLPMILNPMLWVNLVSDWPYQHFIDYHYSAIVIGTVFISLISAISFLIDVSKKRRLGKYVPAALFVILLVGSVASNSIDHPFFRYKGILDPWISINHEYISEIDSIRDAVKDDSVATSLGPLKFLANRVDIYRWPNPFRKFEYGTENSEYKFSRYPKYVILSKGDIGDWPDAFRLLAPHDYSIVKQDRYLIMFQQKEPFFAMSNDLFGSARYLPFGACYECIESRRPLTILDKK